MGSLSGGDRETRAALALTAVRGMGPATIRALIDEYGSATAVLEARLPRLRSVRQVPERRIRALLDAGIRLVSYGTAPYPKRLAHLHHPPPVLYLRGPAPLAGCGSVAIVGTRRATEYGRRMAAEIAAGVATAGRTVVSGLARGIDAAAHRAALEVDGLTVGVLGSGLDHEFPRSSRDLYRALPERGLLVSEFAPEVRPAAGLFPRRNRIIAALADAVVVVQAGRRSGAHITVSHALELGREVFAVPGPVGVAGSEGVHALLRDGATLATCAADVLEELEALPPGDVVPGPDGPAPTEDATARAEAETGRAAAGAEIRTGPAAAEPGRGHPERIRLLDLLGRGTTLVDDLIGAIGLPAGRILALLADLEIEGRIRALPGGRVTLARRAP